MIDHVDRSPFELREKFLKAAEQLKSITQSAQKLLDQLLEVQARMEATRDAITGASQRASGFSP